MANSETWTNLLTKIGACGSECAMLSMNGGSPWNDTHKRLLQKQGVRYVASLQRLSEANPSPIPDKLIQNTLVEVDEALAAVQNPETTADANKACVENEEALHCLETFFV